MIQQKMYGFILAAETDIDLNKTAQSLPQSTPDDATLKVILNIVFGVAGAIALLIIVISGLRYATSDGDPQRMSVAKNGVIYAVIGLAVTLAAYSIVLLAVRAL